jgi:hypothetical protein
MFSWKNIVIEEKLYYFFIIPFLHKVRYIFFHFSYDILLENDVTEEKIFSSPLLLTPHDILCT